ncbi:sensor histidine kinase [Ferruginibacter sp.]
MKKSQKILLHALFWFHTFAWDDTVGQLFVSKAPRSLSFYFNPITISQYLLFPAIFYFNYFFILPHFYKKSRIVKAWAGWILLLAAFILLRYSIQEVLLLKWFGITNYSRGTPVSYYIFDNIYFGGVLIVMSVLLWVIDDNIKTQKEKYQLLEEKRSAELSFLKNQVNPHFLFNTLNNIYSLVSSNSDKALPSIEKLSLLMRYMYKDSNAEKVSLQHEIEYISSFIELQTIRLNNKNIVVYQVNGAIAQQKIAPLILIPFIENMFKHGIINNADKPLHITIDVQGNDLSLTTSNYINHNNKDTSSGIGLENVKKRLALLYPNRYTLNVQQEENIYQCKLQINLVDQ